MYALTEKNTVLSNENNFRAQSLVEIANELEVPKNGKGRFTLNDIKEKVKALNQENKLCKKDISTICETVRKAFIGTGVPKEFYRELGAIKKSELKEVHNLQLALMALLMKYEDTLNDKDKEISVLKDEKTVLSKQPPKEIENPVEIVKEVPGELTVDEIKQTQPYQDLLTNKEVLEKEVKSLVNSGLFTFAEKDDCFEIIKVVKTVLSNSQKPLKITETVEVDKEVPREMTVDESKHTKTYKELEEQLMPDTTDLKFKFLTVQDLEELKPKVTKRFWECLCTRKLHKLSLTVLTRFLKDEMKM